MKEHHQHFKLKSRLKDYFLKTKTQRVSEEGFEQSFICKL